MRLVVIIPARGGSKGIPRKNLVQCAGKPLLAWTIEHAQESVHELELLSELNVDAPEDIVPEIEGGILVSTDDPEIAAYAKDFGVSVLDRPADLASDTALTAPVIAHAVAHLDMFPHAKPDIVAVLQPTVPARPARLLADCVERLWTTGADSVLTAYPLHFVWWKETPTYQYAKDTGGPAPDEWRSQCPRRPRRQDMTAREKMFHEDGSVFVATADLIRKTGEYIGGRMEVVQTPRTVDIDDEVDLALAETLLTYRKVLAEGSGDLDLTRALGRLP